MRFVCFQTSRILHLLKNIFKIVYKIAIPCYNKYKRTTKNDEWRGNMVSNSVLRQNARRQLGGNIFNSKWMTMLAVCAVLSIVSAAAVAMTVIGAIVRLLTESHGQRLSVWRAIDGNFHMCLRAFPNVWGNRLFWACYRACLPSCGQCFS